MYITLISFVIQIIFSLFFIYGISFFLVLFTLQFNISACLIMSLVIISISCLLNSLFTNNPINALLSILLSFVSLSFLLIQNTLEFLMFIFLIVYIGALMMLFLFVIMLLCIQTPKHQTQKNIYIYVFFTASLLIFFFSKILTTYSFLNFSDATMWFSTIFFYAVTLTDGIHALEILYTTENAILIFLTLLLLLTMLGAITIATSTLKTPNINNYGIKK